MNMFVIYEYPSDYPNKFVVRQWRILEGGITQVSMVPHCIATCIEEARKSIAGLRLVRLNPVEGDDPVIREVWL